MNFFAPAVNIDVVAMTPALARFASTVPSICQTMPTPTGRCGAGVVVRVSNAGHRPIRIRAYALSDRHGEMLNIDASGVREMPATLSDGEGMELLFRPGRLAERISAGAGSA